MRARPLTLGKGRSRQRAAGSVPWPGAHQAELPLSQASRGTPGSATTLLYLPCPRALLIDVNCSVRSRRNLFLFLPCGNSKLKKNPEAAVGSLVPRCQSAPLLTTARFSPAPNLRQRGPKSIRSRERSGAQADKDFLPRAGPSLALL